MDKPGGAYLTLGWWLSSEGWREVANRVQDVSKPVSLTTELLIQISRLCVHGLLGEKNFLPAWPPPTPDTLARVLSIGPSKHPALDALVSEARAWLHGADFALVLPAALVRAEGVLLAALESDLFRPDEENLEQRVGPRIRKIPTKRVRLATLLPGVARWAHAAVQGHPDELVDAVAGLHEVEVFCAIVYSAYDDELVAAA